MPIVIDDDRSDSVSRQLLLDDGELSSQAASSVPATPRDLQDLSAVPEGPPGAEGNAGDEMVSPQASCRCV